MSISMIFLTSIIATVALVFVILIVALRKYQLLYFDSKIQIENQKKSYSKYKKEKESQLAVLKDGNNKVQVQDIKQATEKVMERVSKKVEKSEDVIELNKDIMSVVKKYDHPTEWNKIDVSFPDLSFFSSKSKFAFDWSCEDILQKSNLVKNNCYYIDDSTDPSQWSMLISLQGTIIIIDSQCEMMFSELDYLTSKVENHDYELIDHVFKEIKKRMDFLKKEEFLENLKEFAQKANPGCEFNEFVYLMYFASEKRARRLEAFDETITDYLNERQVLMATSFNLVDILRYVELINNEYLHRYKTDLLKDRIFADLHSIITSGFYDATEVESESLKLDDIKGIEITDVEDGLFEGMEDMHSLKSDLISEEEEEGNEDGDASDGNNEDGDETYDNMAENNNKDGSIMQEWEGLLGEDKNLSMNKNDLEGDKESDLERKVAEAFLNDQNQQKKNRSLDEGLLDNSASKLNKRGYPKAQSKLKTNDANKSLGESQRRKKPTEDNVKKSNEYSSDFEDLEDAMSIQELDSFLSG